LNRQQGPWTLLGQAEHHRKVNKHMTDGSEAMVAGQPRGGQDLDSVRSGHWWQAFTGLIPVLVMVPILMAHAYTAGVVVAVAGSTLVVAYHLSRRQGITSLDVLALAFGLANLVLYFGFASTLLIEHLDAAFYSLLAAQSLASLLGRSPWTAQFTRRTVVPDLWDSEPFRAMNVLTTRVWGSCFLMCDIAALTLPDPSRVWAPVVIMIGTVLVSRRLGRRYLARRLRPAEA
jgi:hypothetical protein